MGQTHSSTHTCMPIALLSHLFVTLGSIDTLPYRAPFHFHAYHSRTFRPTPASNLARPHFSSATSLLMYSSAWGQLSFRPTVVRDLLRQKTPTGPQTNQKVFVSSGILSCRCPALLELLDPIPPDTRQNQPLTVSIDQGSYVCLSDASPGTPTKTFAVGEDAFRELLRFIYTGVVQLGSTSDPDVSLGQLADLAQRWSPHLAAYLSSRLESTAILSSDHTRLVLIVSTCSLKQPIECRPCFLGLESFCAASDGMTWCLSSLKLIPPLHHDACLLIEPFLPRPGISQPPPFSLGARLSHPILPVAVSPFGHFLAGRMSGGNRPSVRWSCMMWTKRLSASWSLVSTTALARLSPLL